MCVASLILVKSFYFFLLKFFKSLDQNPLPFSRTLKTEKNVKDIFSFGLSVVSIYLKRITLELQE